MTDAWVGIDLSTNVPAVHGIDDAATQRAVLGSSHLRPSRLCRACQFEADDTGNDEPQTNQPTGCCGFPEQDNAEDCCADCTDSDPNGV